MCRSAPNIPPHSRFDLQAIDACLHRTRMVFDAINARLRVRRDRLDDEVVRNMVEGYAYVDELVRGGIDIFALGSLKGLLEINRLVLCGSSEHRRRHYSAHLQVTERHFYEEREGGVQDLVEWMKDHARDDVWERAAGVYIRILSKPQLFLEGNHRSGTLVISYLLGREGLPPFVLTPENASTYFDPSSLITDTHKKSLSMVFKIPAVKKRLAAFLREQSDPKFLATGFVPDPPTGG